MSLKMLDPTMKKNSYSFLWLYAASLISSCYASTPVPECINCINNQCDAITSGESQCRYGCTDGYWDRQCSSLCPERCTRCSQYPTNTTEPICYRCKSGYFHERSYTCDGTCPNECLTCVASYKCSTCKEGFTGDTCELCIEGNYGKRCNTSCLSYCKDNKCERDNGLCDACLDGRYLDDSSYCLPCPEGCTNCTSRTHCSNCKPGFTGDVCENCVTGKYGLDCNKTCPSKCQTCSSATKCDLCKTGYYNGISPTRENITYNDCRNSCPISCSSCNSYTNCTACNSNFKGDACEHCVDGRYGKDCRMICSVQCLDRICDRVSGNCVACPPGFAGTLCGNCQIGKHGNSCEFNCPNNCKNNSCGRYDGYCTDGCKNDSSHGLKCDSPCSSNCKNNTCARKTSYCNECINTNLQGDFCDKCIPGFYNSSCLSPCPTNCKGNDCEKSTGVCAGQCVQGFHGDRCNDLCTNCNNNTCSKDGTCLYGCDQGYRGTSCSEEISDGRLTSIMIIVVVTVGATIIVLLVVVIVIMIRSKRMKRIRRESEVQLHGNTETGSSGHCYTALNLPAGSSGRESCYSALHIYDEPRNLPAVPGTLHRPVSHQYINTAL